MSSAEVFRCGKGGLVFGGAGRCLEWKGNHRIKSYMVIRIVERVLECCQLGAFEDLFHGKEEIKTAVHAGKGH